MTSASALFLLQSGGKSCQRTTLATCQSHSQAIRNRRGLFPRRNAFSTATTTTSPTAAPPLPPRIVSRRAWEAYKQHHAAQYRKPPPAAGKNKAEEKPWPKSVIYTGYVLGGTLIPYFAVWFAVSNDTVRPWVEPYLSDAVRRHFGTPEYRALPYPDQIPDSLGEAKPSIPHQLPGEWPYEVRQQQAEIVQQEAAGPLPVRVRVYENSSDVGDASVPQLVSEQTTTTLSRTTPATPAQVLPNQKLESGRSVAIDFPADDAVAEDQEGLTESHSAPNSSPLLMPLRAQVATYSLWHYQPVAPGAKEVSLHVSEHEIRKAQLQTDIGALEAELKSGTSRRSVDEIVSELEDRQRQLRRLEWSKWMPW